MAGWYRGLKMISGSESVLLDTSVWVDALRGKTPQVVSLTKNLLDEDRALTCWPVIYEIKRGLRSSERDKILPLFDALIRLPVGENIWDLAGDLDASLRNKGVTVPPMDILIAEICIYHDVHLFTLDEHFKSINKLKLFAL
ncbi:putative Ribonuclease VapC19 [uncultured Desulfobacterium sp.]|uniref:Ribonuclease VapC n=1 Tax=uncultured Desulfobacterium sp. TaxID=201089 RepID=A0A445MV01_9BACT|nr:putative Ribonuclease VapC19 [uncultured Desulfobacterium sp.]